MSEKYIPKDYWESRLGGMFDLRGVGHKGMHQVYNTWAYRARVRVLKGLLDKCGIDPAGKNILDIGFGTGYFISFWGNLGAASVTGVDITPTAIRELAGKYPGYLFVEADFTEEGFSLGKTFDIITVFEVFLHVVEEGRFEQALRNLRAMSGEETVLIINDYFLARPFQPGGHQNIRSLESFGDALRAAGFEILRLEPVFYLMNTPFDAARIASGMERWLVSAAWWFNINLNRACLKLGLLGDAVITVWAPLLYNADRLALALKRAAPGPSTKLALVRTLPLEGAPELLARKRGGS